MKHAREDYDRIQDPAELIPDDEPVFLIRGQDRFGPAAVRAWAMFAKLGGCRADIVRAAECQAEEMERWQCEEFGKLPDMPEPKPVEQREAAG